MENTIKGIEIINNKSNDLLIRRFTSSIRFSATNALIRGNITPVNAVKKAKIMPCNLVAVV